MGENVDRRIIVNEEPDDIRRRKVLRARVVLVRVAVVKNATLPDHPSSLRSGSADVFRRVFPNLVDPCI